MADGAARPRVGVSSCLLGAEVRFNGGHKRSRFLTDSLGQYREDGKLFDHAGRGSNAARLLAEFPLPVALLAHYASSGQWPWLAEQSYLAPFPAGLRLRHSL